MSKLSDTLARLRVCRDARQPVAADLLADAVECLEAVSSAEMSRLRRDQYIRRAALMTGAPSMGRQAECLATEVAALPRRRGAAAVAAAGAEPATVAECLAMASAFCPLPESSRHILRILKESANDPEACPAV